MTTPVLWDYEKLILFVKPFCAFFKQCTAIGFFLISYKHITQILQAIFSAISSLYSGFVAYAATVKAFSCENTFLKRRITRLYGKGVVYEQKYFYQLVIGRSMHKRYR